MLNELHVMTESLAAVVPAEVGREFRSRSDNFDASPRSMELLHGSEFKEIRAICSETVKTFGRLFQATAHAELLRNAVRAHRRRLEEPVLHHYDDIPLRPLRKIAPSRSASSIPPHIPDDNHVYEQDPAAKLSATIVGWREVKSLTHYGVRLLILHFLPLYANCVADPPASTNDDTLPRKEPVFDATGLRGSRLDSPATFCTILWLCRIRHLATKLSLAYC